MQDRPTSRRQFLACTGALAAALVVADSASKAFALDDFNYGFDVPEYQTRIPWLISEADLYERIPRSVFDYSLAGWPVLHFTVFGIKAAYGFNFVTHPEDLLLEICYMNLDESSVLSTYRSAASHLSTQLPEPERQNGQMQFWSTSSTCLRNSIDHGYFDLLNRDVCYHGISLAYLLGWPT